MKSNPVFCQFFPEKTFCYQSVPAAAPKGKQNVVGLKLHPNYTTQTKGGQKSSKIDQNLKSEIIQTLKSDCIRTK